MKNGGEAVEQISNLMESSLYFVFVTFSTFFHISFMPQTLKSQEINFPENFILKRTSTKIKKG